MITSPLPDRRPISEIEGYGARAPLARVRHRTLEPSPVLLRVRNDAVERYEVGTDTWRAMADTHGTTHSLPLVSCVTIIRQI